MCIYYWGADGQRVALSNVESMYQEVDTDNRIVLTLQYFDGKEETIKLPFTTFWADNNDVL